MEQRETGSVKEKRQRAGNREAQRSKGAIEAAQGRNPAKAPQATFHPTIANPWDEVEQDAGSIMTFVMSLIRNKLHFRLQGGPISMSATMRERAIIFCTMFSLQICFLLSVKSMRRNPPPGARITFRGSTSPCMTPILWRS